MILAWASPFNFSHVNKSNYDFLRFLVGWERIHVWWDLTTGEACTSTIHATIYMHVFSSVGLNEDCDVRGAGILSTFENQKLSHFGEQKRYADNVCGLFDGSGVGLSDN